MKLYPAELRMSNYYKKFNDEDYIMIPFKNIVDVEVTVMSGDTAPKVTLTYYNRR